MISIEMGMVTTPHLEQFRALVRETPDGDPEVGIDPGLAILRILEGVMSLNGFALADSHQQDSLLQSGPLANGNAHLVEDDIFKDYEFEGIVGQSSALQSVLQLVNTVAGGNATVLLLGETGTGKELIARAIHNRSPRRERPFVKLNCAAIPCGLLESELFGHERGAFTGAIAQKIGRLKLADQGSLFLDEIGDIPLELQPKLLRVLQEREFERLGSARTQKVDVRIVAATHCELEEMVIQRKFRSDLYYRLNVFPIRVPPLRERPNDIPLLVQYFIHRAASRMNKIIGSVPTKTMDALARYPWPGNIRELENVIERAVIISRGSTLEVSLLDLKSRIQPQRDADCSQTLEEVDRKHILAVLKRTKWVLSGPNGAAKSLGLNRSTLYFRMQKLGIVRSFAPSLGQSGDQAESSSFGPH